MIYGYARVSTKGQERDGNSLEAQERLLKDNGARSFIKTASQVQRFTALSWISC